MEEAQREHIIKNLPDLIKDTTWNTDLQARLLQKGILSDIDVENINSCKGPSEKSSKLYDFLLTRSNSYDPFISILCDVKQSGAATILQRISDEYPTTPSHHPMRFKWQQTRSQHSVNLPLPDELVIVVVRASLDDSTVKLEQNSSFKFTTRKLTDGKYFRESLVEGQNTKVYIISHDLIDDVLGNYNKKRTFFFENEFSWNNLYDNQRDNVLQREIFLNGQSMPCIDILRKIYRQESDVNIFLRNLSDIELLEVLDTSRQIGIGDHLPQLPKHYVPRKLNSNRRLSPRILDETKHPENKDIFFFEYLDWHELTSLVQKFATGNTNTDLSFHQLQRQDLSVKFILLKNKNHFDKFKHHSNIYNYNLHWLRCKKNTETHEVQELYWVKTCGSMKTIQQFIHPFQNHLEEMDVLTRKKEFQRPKLISGSPCSGKSTLMASIARKLQSEDVMNFVHIIKIDEFLDELLTKWHDQWGHANEAIVMQQEPDEDSSNSEELMASTHTPKIITGDDIYDVVFSLLSKSSVGQKLTREFLKSTTCQLVCTDFHDLSPERIKYANKLFNFFNHDSTFHLWVTSSPHLVRGLEETLSVLGYTVIPIDEKDQIELIVKNLQSRQNSNKEPQIKPFLHDVVAAALGTLRKSMSTDLIDVCAFPMLCELFAEVIKPWLESENNDLTDKSCEEFGKYISSSTISDLFGKVIASRFKLTSGFESSNFTSSNISEICRADDTIKQSVYVHMLFAIKQNLPKHVFEKVKIVLKGFPEAPAETEKILIKSGFLQKIHGRKRIWFIHSCYSEYFVALAVIEMMHLLQFQVEVKSNSSTRDELVDALLCICKSVFATEPVKRRISMHCNPIRTFLLKHRHICYFLNALLPTPIKHSCTDPLIISYIKQNDHDEISQDLWKVLNALILESFDKLVLPVVECIKSVFVRESINGSDKRRFRPKDDGQSTSNFPSFENLPYLATSYGKLDLVQIIFEFYKYWSGKSVHTLGISCQPNFGLLNHDLLGKQATILHIAVEAGQYQVVEHLLTKKYFANQLSEESYTDLLYFCVLGSLEDDEEVIPFKGDILQLLVDQRPDLKNGIDKNGSLSLVLQPIHFKLLLVLLNISQNDKSRPEIGKLHIPGVVNEDGMTILHLLAQGHYCRDRNATPKIYQDVLKELDVTAFLQFRIRDRLSLTPLHWAVLRIALAYETLEILVQHEVNLNSLDNRNCPVIFKAMEGQRDQDFLKNLIKCGADLRLRNKTEVCSLHVAAGCWNYDAVSLILAGGHLKVNVVDSSGNTPLHYVFSKELTERETKPRTPANTPVEPNNQHNIIKALIENGANINAVNEDGHTPLALALEDLCVGAEPDILETLERNRTKLYTQEMMTYVLAGILTNAKFGREWYPGLVSILCNELISQGADINFKHTNGATMLHLAAKNHALAGVEFITENEQFNRNTLDNDGKTPKEYMHSSDSKQSDSIDCYQCADILKFLQVKY